MKGYVIANANAKGGIGKTTNSLGLSYALSHLGFNVLLIDGDPQASSTNDLCIDPDSCNTLDELIAPMVEAELEKYEEEGYAKASEYWNAICEACYDWNRVSQFIYTPSYGRARQNGMKWETIEVPFGDDLGKFDLIPSNIKLSIMDSKMGMASKYFGFIYTNYIYDLVSSIKQQDIYDYIILDLPPQISALSNNLLAAATDGIILCSNLDVQSIRGFDSITDAISAVQNLNPNHRGVLGILFSMYSERRTTDKSIEDIAKQYVPIPIFDTKIPETADVRKAYANGRLVNQINKKTKEAYTQLAKEIHYAMLYPESPIGTNKKNGGEE